MTLEPHVERYIRQIRFAPLGENGQRRLLASRVLIVGCGALGTVLANTLARAGVGYLRIVDRDFIETNNLQRQVLFDERDVAEELPKAIAAANKLRQINSHIEVEPLVIDVEAANIVGLCEGIDLILDGTDNFETRFLINDVAVKLNLPWIYGGCLGAEGQSMTILPGDTPCLRCLIPEPPAAGTTPTCDTAGIVAPIINVIASIEAMEALKILSGRRDAISRSLTIIELWENRFRSMKLDNLRESVDCACCRRREFSWLDGARASQSAVLCGRNAVQISPPNGTRVELTELAKTLMSFGTVTQNAFLLRFTVDRYRLTIFPDGRAIIGGTDDIAEAKSVYARYIGH